MKYSLLAFSIVSSFIFLTSNSLFAKDSTADCFEVCNNTFASQAICSDELESIRQDKFVEGAVLIGLKKGLEDINFTYIRGEKNNGTRARVIKPQVKKFGIQKIERQFKRLDELRHIYRIEFDHTTNADQLVKELEENAFIEYAEKIAIPKLMFTPNDEDPSQWYFNTIDAHEAWDITQGASNVVVAVVDDGVLTSHEELSSKMWVNSGEVAGDGVDNDGNGYDDDVNGYDVGDDDGNPNPPGTASDFNFSHGTHCAGLIAAATNNGNGIAALGFNVSLMAVKAKADTDVGTDLSKALEGVEYAIAAKANVINMSWAMYAYSPTWAQLLDVAYNNDITLVAASGNDGAFATMYPAGYVPVIGVGATDGGDVRLSTSNYGLGSTNVMAPGENAKAPVASSNSAYANYSGTSVSCALVSGLAALMKSHDASATPKRIKECIENTSESIEASNGGTGFLLPGRINAHEALLCLNIPPFAFFEFGGFTVEAIELCPGASMQLLNTSLGPNQTNWDWNIPGGTPSSSTEENPMVSFDNPGEYDITLTVSNPYGSDSETLTIVVEEPTAVMTGDTVIIGGYGSYLTFNFTGTPPWTATYNDGTNNITLYNIYNSTYYQPIAPSVDQTYCLVSATDANCATTASGCAEVTVLDVPTCTDCPYDYVQNVLIGGGCINVFNVQFTGLEDEQIGHFYGGPDLDIGFDEGVVLCSGEWENLIYAPNNQGGAGTGLGTPGDSELSDLVGLGTVTNDAAVLEFDFIPSTDTMRFNYVFGSEEYNEFVGSSYNDVFGFFVSGPGITGVQNIALIPGTITPVSINNVNNGSNPAYYVDNEFSTGNTQFDGYTVPLTAIITGLTPCEIYHIKLAVADVADGILDSGVFLEAYSFVSGTVTNINAYGSLAGTTQVFEGCETGFFEVVRGNLETLDEPYTIDLIIGGTAIPGYTVDSDYEPLPESITIPAGDTTVLVPIFAYQDALNEVVETITVSLENEQCDCTNIPVTAILLLYDNVLVEAGDPITICKGEPVFLSASPNDNVSYQWEPNTFMDDNTIPNPTVYPDTTTTYAVRSIDSNGCEAEDYVTVYVVSDPPQPNMMDTVICGNAGEQTFSIGSGSVVPGYFYQWEPAALMTNPNVPSPEVTLDETTTFQLTIQNSTGCESTGSLTVTFLDTDIPVTVANGEICGTGDSFTLMVEEEFETYLWSDGSTDSVLVVSEIGSYGLTVTDADGCAVSAEPEVVQAAIPEPTITGELIFSKGESSTLSLAEPFSSYLWTTGDTSPETIITEAGTYGVTVINESGCEAYAEVETETIESEPYAIPNAFSPNGDGMNDIFRFIPSDKVVSAKMEVFNRWGNKVFSTEELGAGWDGVYQANNAESGVYVYYVTLTLLSGKSETIKGNVTLIR